MTKAGRTTLIATLVCGTADILSALFFGGLDGQPPGAILRFVASGPFGSEMHKGGMVAAAVGLLVHYLLMLAMVALFVVGARRFPSILRHWWLGGVLYGLAIYLVMYWIVLPTRFELSPRTDAWHLGNALFSHIVCVGLPLAFITWRMLGSGLRRDQR